jgi:DNA-binding beta-propeller fold protein YncE
MQKNWITGDCGMKQTCVRPCFTKILLMVALVMLPVVASAESAWEWQTSLRVDKAGDAMYMPSAVAFDKASDRYYVVDTGRDRLVSFEKDGKLIRGFTANDQLKAPFDMVRLDNGNLWVVEKGRNSLTLIDIAGKGVTPHTLKDGKQLVFPDRLAVAGGKLFVLDRASGQVLRLAPDLSIEQHFGCSDCIGGLGDFVVDGDSIMALAPRDKKVYRFNADGTIAKEIELGGELEFPVSLAVGPAGTIYVLDRHQNGVLTYNENGQFMYRFLGPGKGPQDVYFPRQIRFDPWGRLCVVDEGNGRVEVFSQ